MKNLIVALLIISLSISLAFADIFYLKNGKIEEGKVIRKSERPARVQSHISISSIEEKGIYQIEYEKLAIEEQKKKEKIKEPEKGALQEDDAYLLWKESMEHAARKRKKGLILSITGAAAIGIGTALVLSTRKEGPKEAGMYYDLWSRSYYAAVEQRKYYQLKWPSIVCLSSGAVLAVYGLYVFDSGNKIKKHLEEEGKRKGYIAFNIDPRFNQVQIAYKIDF